MDVLSATLAAIQIMLLPFPVASGDAGDWALRPAAVSPRRF